MDSLFSREKRRFPWLRLLLGAYFSTAGVVGLIRIPFLKHLNNPYLIPAAISLFVAGAVLLASGLWVVFDRREAS